MIIVDGVKKLVKQIMVKAEDNAEDIIVDAETLIERTIEKKKREAILEYKKIIDDTIKQTTDEQKKIIAKEILNLKTVLEFKKIEFLSKMYQKVSEKCFVRDENYTVFLENAIINSTNYLKDNTLIINCCSTDRKIFTNQFISYLEKKTMRKIILSKEDINISQGIIIKVKDQNIVFDCSLDYRLKQIWNDIKILIADKLHDLQEV